MNSFIADLNQWGGHFFHFALPILWQSSLLILVLFTVDFLSRNRIRASVRYALWLVVLVKLCLPPNLALPTSPAWWLHQTQPPAVARLHYTVSYGTGPMPDDSPTPPPAYVPPRPVMTGTAWLFVTSGFVSTCLFGWLLVHWWQITQQARCAKNSERLTAMLTGVQHLADAKSTVPVRLTENSMSPAVCGLFHPVILIPQSLAEGFSDEQLRAVLLHEMMHLRRRDVWLNFLQALIQIVYWWHPLVWLANARIRRVREEAVDDAVMLALREASDSYAPTLLEVAKLALNRPLASLGLVGILESRSALRQRIERLVNFRPPRRADLTLVSLLGIAAFAAIAVLMGAAPAGAPPQTLSDISSDLSQADSSISEPMSVSSLAVSAEIPFARTFKIERPIDGNALKELLRVAGVKTPPTVFYCWDNGILLVRGSAEQLELVEQVVRKLNGFSQQRIAVANQEPVNPAGTARFERQEQNATNIFSRTFRVDAYAFTSVLRNMPGLKTNDVVVMAKSLFTKLGVNWETPKGKAVFYNDGLALLFVRATLSDLDTVEQAVQALRYAEPQIHIKAQFIEAPKGTLEGFKNIIGGTNQPIQGVDILFSESANVLLKNLRSRYDVKTLAEPEGTTVSERQMQMRATQVITIITNFALYEKPTYSVTAIVPQTNEVEVGPVVDVVPYVLSDNHAVDLQTIASVKEFLGYDQPTNTAVAYTSTGQKIDMPTILPSFAIRKASANIRLWDGQTVILGGIQRHFYDGGKEVSAEPDYFVKTKAARGQPDEQDKELLVFITVTLIDRAGNRVHSDDEIPFAKNSIPPQREP